MLQLNILSILKARGIEQPYKFLVKNGFVPFTAHKLKNNKVEHIRIDHIERLCVLLNCTPNDIFEWMPNDLLDDKPEHPLQKLRKTKRPELHKLLSKVPAHRLKDAEALLANLS